MAGRKWKSSFLKYKKLYLVAFLLVVSLAFQYYLDLLFGINLTRVLQSILLIYFAKLLISDKTNPKGITNSKKLFSFKTKVKNILQKIPTVIWGGFAVLGIFLFGFLIGAEVNNNTLKEDFNISSQSEKYRDVIDGYQDLSKIIYLQQQDMDIITNSSMWQDHPEEVYDAISSYQDERDSILFQFGRIYELRNKASLPRDENLKSN